MATSTFIPVEEYLQTDYSPDCDYVDGEIQERNVGEYDHSTVQHMLLMYFQMHADAWDIRVRPELRLQISPTRFRVPDVMLLPRNAPREQIVQHAPVLCIEVLSPEDRFSRMRQKIGDYLSIGSAVWVVDPSDQKGYAAHGPSGELSAPLDILTVPDTPIVLVLPTFFKSLQE